MCRKLICLTSFVVVLALAGYAQAELLVNPDFEAGLEGWKTWGGGSGSGAGGWFYNSDTHATVMEGDTAHGGDKYVEVGIADMADSWWAVSLVFQEHAVTEGQTYQSRAWFRDGDADGAPSLIANGGMLQWEWRDAAADILFSIVSTAADSGLPHLAAKRHICTDKAQRQNERSYTN